MRPTFNNRWTRLKDAMILFDPKLLYSGLMDGLNIIHGHMYMADVAIKSIYLEVQRVRLFTFD